MARKRRISSIPAHAPISIGNCEVTVDAKNFTSESNQEGIQISISRTAKIRIAVVEKVEEREFGGRRPEKFGDCYFVLANPNDSDVETKSLLQEVLTLYMKELPAMSYASNTGKQSMFLERCVTNGKFCTLLLKSKDDKPPGEIIAAITYQIIPADTQYAEVPLAAVNSSFQRKGIGRLLYLELRKRLWSVGIRTVFCWGDKESEGFWLKQDFRVIGEVNRKGRARRLPVKADIRKALCFPGDSTLMISHLPREIPSKSVELLELCLQVKPPETNCTNKDQKYIAESDGHSNDDNQIIETGVSKTQKLVSENLSADGCRDLVLLPVAEPCATDNAFGTQEAGSKDDEDICSCSMQESKKRMWETSCTSLKSKKVKGAQSNDCQLSSQSPFWTSNGRNFESNCLMYSGDNSLANASISDSGKNSMYRKTEVYTAGKITNQEYGYPKIPATCKIIMLMNIADEKKKEKLTEIIEILGGVVTSDGSVCTHIVTGKVRKTLNFCTALSSGAWVISSAWLKESWRKKRFVDETTYILKDKDYRATYRCELKSAVLRAKSSPNALLKGLDIWLATHFQHPANDLSAIVKSAGGNVVCTKKEVKNITKTIFIACEEDMDEALSALKMGIYTFSFEWLTTCVMRQELDLEAPQFAETL